MQVIAPSANLVARLAMATSCNFYAISPPVFLREVGSECDQIRTFTGQVHDTPNMLWRRNGKILGAKFRNRPGPEGIERHTQAPKCGAGPTVLQREWLEYAP